MDKELLKKYLAKLETMEDKFPGSAWPWSKCMVNFAISGVEGNYSRPKGAVSCKEAMATKLDEIKNLADTLFICEVGVGLDLLYASQVKQWKKVICYDRMPESVGDALQTLFTHIGIPTTVEYRCIQTPVLDGHDKVDMEITPFEEVIKAIDEDVILIWLVGWASKTCDWLDICKSNSHIKGIVSEETMGHKEYTKGHIHD